MRDRSNTVSPSSNVPGGNEIRIMRIAAVPATKCTFMPHVPLDLSTPGTRLRRVGGIDHLHTQAMNRCQQQDSIAEESSGMLSPANQPVRVFQTDASTRTLTHGDNLPSFTGKNLSLRTHFNAPVDAPLLVHRFAVALSFQDRSEIGASVAVRAGHSSTSTDVTAEPFFHGLHFGQGHLNAYPTVPLAILSEDLALLTESCPREREGAVDRSMLARWDVQLPDALNHHPQVKAGRLSRRLHLSGINQFSPECGGLEWLAGFASGLQAPTKVSKGTARSTSGKLARSFARGDAGLLHSRDVICGIGMQPTKQPRQESQRVCLIRRRMKFEFVREYNGRFHTTSLTETPPRAKSRSRPSLDGERPLRLRFSGPMKTGFALAHQSGFKADHKETPDCL